MRERNRNRSRVLVDKYEELLQHICAAEWEFCTFLFTYACCWCVCVCVIYVCVRFCARVHAAEREGDRERELLLWYGNNLAWLLSPVLGLRSGGLTRWGGRTHTRSIFPPHRNVCMHMCSQRHCTHVHKFPDTIYFPCPDSWKLACALCVCAILFKVVHACQSVPFSLYVCVHGHYATGGIIT